MKSLKDFIEERRLTIGSTIEGGMTFEEFKDFVNAWANDADIPEEYDIKAMRLKISNTIKRILGIESTQKAFDILFAWMQSASLDDDKVDDQEIQDFYDFFMNMNPRVKEKKKFISAGSEGIVFDEGDKIVKFYFRPIDKRLMPFFEKLKDSNYETLPKLYHIGKSYIVMEKLKVNSVKCRKISRELMYYRWNTDDEKVIAWQNVFEKEAEDCGLSDLVDGYYDELDCHEGNFGERANGDIVFFDPIYMNER